MGLEVVGKVVCDRCRRTETVPVEFSCFSNQFSIRICDETSSCRVFANLKPPEKWVKKYDLILCPNCAKAFEEFMKC